MIVATVKEIKNGEGRVGLTPYGADALIKAGHKVLVEKGAGEKSGFSDDDYKKVGAEIIPLAPTVYKKAEMIIKVKEPQESEFKFYRPGLILYTYLHLAAEPKVTKMLLDKKVTAVAYETIELPNGILPLLKPMSEVAGRMSVQLGAWFLQKPNGGEGVLLGGVPGVMPGKVVILGTGAVSTNACKIAVGMGARVSIFGIDAESLRHLDNIFAGRINTLFSNSLSIAQEIRDADLVISGVLVTGAKAPKLITRKMLKTMKKGSVIVDVSIDQGGSTETSKRTSHQNPIYEVDGVIHYCVPNIPGAVPQTSTMALTNVTIAYALDIANTGLKKAVGDNPSLAKGINTIDGKCTYKPVADALNLEFTTIEKVIEKLK